MLPLFMEDKLTKKAEELDNLRLNGTAEKLTLEEAENIVQVWGIFLEHSGGLRTFFGIDIPRSLLPYPIEIIQGALNKMEALYWKAGNKERVKLLEETEMLLMQFSDDKEAIENTIKRLQDEDWQEIVISSIKNYQKSQSQNGYLVNKKVFEISETRLNELIG